MNVDPIGDELAPLLVLPEERLILREKHLDPHQVIVPQVIRVRRQRLSITVLCNTWVEDCLLQLGRRGRAASGVHSPAI
jgi:hypothetical protein